MFVALVNMNSTSPVLPHPIGDEVVVAREQRPQLGLKVLLLRDPREVEHLEPAVADVAEAVEVRVQEVDPDRAHTLALARVDLGKPRTVRGQKLQADRALGPVLKRAESVTKKEMRFTS